MNKVTEKFHMFVHQTRLHKFSQKKHPQSLLQGYFIYILYGLDLCDAALDHPPCSWITVWDSKMGPRVKVQKSPSPKRHFNGFAKKCLHRAGGERAQLVQIFAFRRLQSWVMVIRGVGWCVVRIAFCASGCCWSGLWRGLYGNIALNDMANET